jgi:hypothetical protein
MKWSRLEGLLLHWVITHLNKYSELLALLLLLLPPPLLLLLQSVR